MLAKRYKAKGRGLQELMALKKTSAVSKDVDKAEVADTIG